jgi:ATP-binding cassette subfamily B protein
MYLQQLTQPLQRMFRLWKDLSMNWVDIELVLELMFTHEEIKEPENPIHCKWDRGDIEFKNVTFTYDKDKP